MILAFDLLASGPSVSIGICLLGVLGILATRRMPNVREGVSLTTAVVNFGLVLWMYGRFQAGETLGSTLLEIVPGLEIGFRVDALGILFALVASGLWILNTLYSIGYMRAHEEPRQTRFYSCFAIAIAACMGAAFSSNLFSMFAFYELLTICTYPLVIHAQTDTARAGAKRYVTYLLGASLCFLLPAMFLIWQASGAVPSLQFAEGGLLASSTASGFTLGLAFLLAVAGLAKCGVMPLHSWLPAAMVAPTPVSALLHAVAVVKMGVFGVCRIVFHVFGVDLLGRLGVADVLLYAACFTIVVGSLVALVQDNLKRRLAYSTISQLSYILLGVALLAPAAGVGGVAHIGFHAVSKITLFFAAGAIYVAAHKTKVSELDGIGRRMPITMAAFTIGALSMIGLPPTAGIVSKWWLVRGAVEVEQWPVLAVLLISTLLNAGYFLPIVWRAFFRPSPEGTPSGLKEAPLPCVIALSGTALLTLLCFFYPDLFVDLAAEVAGYEGGRP
ncbi:MAG: monovalent cation/H+ antiporter subunit D family protein [Planctomycetota bacterium]|nr:monovalent cation/H+ antiporter subunit D family protein [Planctomycetota bacterium]